jgi:hypothetical protein
MSEKNEKIFLKIVFTVFILTLLAGIVSLSLPRIPKEFTEIKLIEFPKKITLNGKAMVKLVILNNEGKNVEYSYSIISGIPSNNLVSKNQVLLNSFEIGSGKILIENGKSKQISFELNGKMFKKKGTWKTIITIFNPITTEFHELFFYSSVE